MVFQEVTNDWLGTSKQSLAKACQTSLSIGAVQQRVGARVAGWGGRSMAQSGANRSHLTNSTALKLLGDILSKKKESTFDFALVGLDEVIGDDIFLIDRLLSASLKILLHLTLLSRHQWGNSTGIPLVRRPGAGERP